MALETTKLDLSGMTCDHCVRTVEASLLNVAGVRAASAQLRSQSAVVEYDPALVELADMEEAVAAAGYAPRPHRELVSLPIPPAARPADQPTPVRASKAPAASQHQEIRLVLEGMTCASCVRTVEQAALQVPGVRACEVNLTEATAHVVLDPARGGIDDVTRAIRSAGYGATTAPVGSASGVDDGKSGTLRRRLQVSAALTVPLLVLAMSHGRLAFPGSVWVQLALTLPVLLYGGAPFYTAAWNAARHGRSDMNTLIAVGTATAFLFSLAATVAPGWVSRGQESAPVYFETSAAILTLVLLGRVLEARARRRTSNSIHKLLALQQDRVLVRRDGGELEISLEEVVVGDEVLVRPGERIPVDGLVLDGAGAVDESALTGESVPADKQPGSPVVSGSLNQDAALVLRAESVGRDTVLSRIVEYVRRAQGSKAPAARLADRIAAVFVPAILAAAVVTFGVWWFVGPGDDRLRMALTNAVSVLIIACPCALGLATPAALAVGIGRAAEHGILIRDGAALESARTLNTVVFDKTGTLTRGEFSLTDIEPFGDVPSHELLAAAGAIERLSEHPIAKAIVAASPSETPAVEHYRAHPGSGASARVAGESWLLGKPAWLVAEGIEIQRAKRVVEQYAEQGKSVILAAKNGGVAGAFALRDTIRPDGAAAVKALQGRGMRMLMLSGDNAAAARSIASEAGIQDVLAPVLPTEKATAIEQLQREGGVVAMVGDGINDAPALAQADLGIAVGAGTDIAVESAGIILVRNSPVDVDRAIELAERTQRTIRQNYFWAFAYNLLGVPIAAGVLYPWTGLLLSPILASAAMALSSVSVLSNSLRLNRALSTER